MPLFHVTGMQCSMNQPIYHGATIVLMTRWDRDTAAELIQPFDTALLPDYEGIPEAVRAPGVGEDGLVVEV